MGAAVLVEIDLALDHPDDRPDELFCSKERVLRLEGQVVRHEEAGHTGFAVMATQTSIEPSSLVMEELV